jgi:hypothetical protein
MFPGKLRETHPPLLTLLAKTGVRFIDPSFNLTHPQLLRSGSVSTSSSSSSSNGRGGAGDLSSSSDDYLVARGSVKDVLRLLAADPFHATRFGSGQHTSPCLPLPDPAPFSARPAVTNDSGKIQTPGGGGGGGSVATSAERMALRALLTTHLLSDEGARAWLLGSRGSDTRRGSDRPRGARPGLSMDGSSGGDVRGFVCGVCWSRGPLRVCLRMPGCLA